MLRKVEKRILSFFGDFCGIIDYQKDTTRGLILGLYDSGKTTILYYMKYGFSGIGHQIYPNATFNIEKLTIKGTSFTIYDVGDFELSKPLLSHYIESIKLVFYVIDSSKHIHKAVGELELIVNELSLLQSDAVIIAVLNKQDIQSLITEDEFNERIKEMKLPKNLSIFSFPTIAAEGKGVRELFFFASDLLKMEKGERKKLCNSFYLKWNFRNHKFFPREFKKKVWSLLLISKRVKYIPDEIIREIFSFLTPLKTKWILPFKEYNMKNF